MSGSTAIFQPVIAMFALTALVWAWMYYRRLSFMRAERVDPQVLALPERTTVPLPESVVAPSNNLKNLFELPVLFYAGCIVASLVGAADGTFVALAWSFVGFRAVHSAIHCTVNHVMSRFAAYAVSSLVLWVMLALLAFRVI